MRSLTIATVVILGVVLIVARFSGAETLLSKAPLSRSRDDLRALDVFLVELNTLNEDFMIGFRNCAREPWRAETQLYQPMRDRIAALRTSLTALINQSNSPACRSDSQILVRADAFAKLATETDAVLARETETFRQRSFATAFRTVEYWILEGLRWDASGSYPNCQAPLPESSRNPHGNPETLDFVSWKKSLFCVGLIEDVGLGAESLQPTQRCLRNALRKLARELTAADPATLCR